MQLSGLIRLGEDNLEYTREVANMMGESFLEENWTATLFSALTQAGVSDERILAISQELIYNDFLAGSAFGCAYALPEAAAAAGVYRKSEMGDKHWAHYEDISFENLASSFLSAEEKALLEAQSERMAAISIFDWEEDHAAGRDFLHMYLLGVNVTSRKSGAFRRLIEPIFALADEEGIDCYLESYSEQLVSLYEYFGFKTIQTFSDPSFTIKEYCMVRTPHTAY